MSRSSIGHPANAWSSVAEGRASGAGSIVREPEVMSCFIVTVGKKLDVKIPGVTLVPLSQAQQYIKDRATDLAAGHDRSNLFVICDPALEESADLVAMAQEQVHLSGSSLESTALGQVIAACVAAGNSLRIWWANNDPQAHQKVVECGDSSRLKDIVVEQIRANRDVAVFYNPQDSAT